jgi:acyl-CoA synthetase (NDP forming)
VTASSLAPFFAPRSVAVIGASRDPSKIGGSVLANLRSAGFGGRVIPVNTRAEMVQGLTAVPSLLDVDGPVDLAVITVPAPAVLPVLKECVSKGVGGAVSSRRAFANPPARGGSGRPSCAGGCAGSRSASSDPTASGGSGRPHTST